MKKKILIFTPSYNETIGGVVVLHKLCSILNDLGFESYLAPYSYSYEMSRYHLKESLVNFFKWSFKNFFKTFKTNPAFNTPIYKRSIEGDDEWVVVYPEVVFGNPLKAKNVVRWLLHQPGFHNGKVYYGKGELYFKFNGAINDFDFPGSYTSQHQLKVIHYPLEHYHKEGTCHARSGTAYCLRKGKSKYKDNSHDNDILIDGKSHQEVAKILRGVDKFISYDTYTAYSIFAVLCGAQSIVIPDNNVSEAEWYPLESDRYGISYGLDNLDWACNTKDLVKEHVQQEEDNNTKNVEIFISEINDYFY